MERARHIRFLSRPESRTGSIHKLIPERLRREFSIEMVNIVGKRQSFRFFQVDESHRRTRAGNLAITREKRKDVWSTFFIDNVASSIKVGAKRIRIPVLARVVFFVLRERRMDKSNDVWQRLGQIDNGSSAVKLLDRHNANVGINTVAARKDDLSGKRLASRSVECCGRIDGLVARA